MMKNSKMMIGACAWQYLWAQVRRPNMMPPD